jgi:Uma2 family endonuclease
MLLSKEAFLAWVEQREERYEYAGGRANMMVHVTLNHAEVTTNLVHILKSRLPVREFNIVSEAFAVTVGDSIRFPDVLVQPRNADGKTREANAPILIIEVLSPSTLHTDFGEKRQEYLGLPTLDTYLIVSPDEPQAWIWQRADGEFPSEPEIVEGLDKLIALPALGVQIPFNEIYRGIL